MYSLRMTNKTRIDGNRLAALMMERNMTKETLAAETQKVARKEGKDFTWRMLDLAIREGVINNTYSAIHLAVALSCKYSDLVKKAA